MIDQAGKIGLIFLSRIDQAVKECLICLLRIDQAALSNQAHLLA